MDARKSTAFQFLVFSGCERNVVYLVELKYDTTQMSWATGRGDYKARKHRRENRRN